MRRMHSLATAALLALPIACAQSAPPAAPRSAAPSASAFVPPPTPSAVVESPPTWPEPLAGVMSGRGEPHAQPIPLPRDARGRERWLAFAGGVDAAVGAWRITRADAGATVEPVEHWPAGARVLGGVVQDGVAYVLLESQHVLDQPAGLRGVWIDAGTLRSPFEASPMALADVHDAAELASRVAHPPPVGSSDRTAVALLATLRAASASTATLARALAAEGAEVEVAWQSTFMQPVGKLDGEGSTPSPLADRVLADVRAAVTTQACGADACEAWTDAGHAVVRFVVQGGRWVVRTIIEDAPLPHTTATATPHEVEPSAGSSATESALRARAREVKLVLGEAPLTSIGGTIGVGLTDLAPDAPVVAIREAGATRVFALDAGTGHNDATETRWDAAFADVDGDGRTDVVVRMSGKRVDGAPLAWTQIYLAPPPSVQATSLEADLPSALVVMDAADARSAAHSAAAMPPRAVSRDDACRLLAAASTPAGFRRVASADARVLLFNEPAMPTWRPKIVPASKVAADDVRGLGAHCAELACSATRSYCAWTAGADSQHFWFGWRDGRLALVGAADYQGE